MQAEQCPTIDPAPRSTLAISGGTCFSNFDSLCPNKTWTKYALITSNWNKKNEKKRKILTTVTGVK